MTRRRKKLTASIRDFGVEVGTGFTDDTAAFKAAKASKFERIELPVPASYQVNKAEVDLDHRFVVVRRKRHGY